MTARGVAERLGGFEPEAAIILGSGLGSLADRVDVETTIPYADIPGLPAPTVKGHGGELIAGTLEDRRVLLQRGRLHFYEGHPAQAVVLPVRLAAALGARFLIVTNAAGGLRPTVPPPALMLIADHVNLQFRFPLVGPVVPPEPRFPDMSEPYDRELRALARQVALQHRIRLDEGVYIAVLGPSYETPAEIGMLRRLGADAVGMSTVPEVIVARARGLRVLGISVISNYAAGITPEPLDHAEVLEAGRVVAADLESMVRGVVKNLPG